MPFLLPCSVSRSFWWAVLSAVKFLCGIFFFHLTFLDLPLWTKSIWQEGQQDPLSLSLETPWNSLEVQKRPQDHPLCSPWARTPCKVWGTLQQPQNIKKQGKPQGKSKTEPRHHNLLSKFFTPKHDQVKSGYKCRQGSSASPIPDPSDICQSELRKPQNHRTITAGETKTII